MRHHVRRLAARHEPPGQAVLHLKSGAGATLGLAAVAGLAGATGLPLLLAPLGATVVLLFGQPASPLAQPANVFGGYALGALIGMGAALAWPGHAGGAAGAVGLAIALMLTLRVTHPPAGAVPLVALGSPDGAAMLLPDLLLAAALLVALAAVVHRLPPRTAYPRPLPDGARGQGAPKTSSAWPR